MSKLRIAAPALVVLATLAGVPASPLGVRPAFAADSRSADQPWESVLVTGRGEAVGTPDTLTTEFSVETSAATVAEALKRATAAATRMRDALLHAKVAAADLQTSTVSIGTSRDKNGKITGYTVTQGLTAKIRNLPQAGALMTATIAAGGDAARLNGASFAIENDTALLTAARTKAFADAKAKAMLYAKEAGRPLGRVVKVSESTPGSGSPIEPDRMMSTMAGADAPIPIEPGRQRLTVTVTVEWVLDPAVAARS
ncbi:SIMPL domain-containing protein [Actinoplanes palleronii]|uniref:Conserved lipoprotein LpqG n=1 Tax=Actinoplanes palleronii TaxID=113570 RepID=A0ABQ4BPL0_9ACTN|nr:SIMPL domain-containing protein [Actinoplanes palleronii]GIE72615.1 putative conserved lipoprotein LpqG [Actinoplanes palleronii]